MSRAPRGTIFAEPVPGQQSLQSSYHYSLKRKRNVTRVGHQDAVTVAGEEPHELSSSPKNEIEYTSVLTPLERSQRRLAGQPLDQEAPAWPYPHAPQPAPEKISGRRLSNQTSKTQRRPTTPYTSSLRARHMSAITAVLHKSLLARDFLRARRAFGLLLHTEADGHPVDIRENGTWGIGAELLFRPSIENGPDNSTEKMNEITQDGFQRAKAYYEKLILQYPPHKSWPSHVNARDFYAAMFGLWIYVVNRDSLQMQQLEEDDGADNSASPSMPHQRAKAYELQQAELIAERMDQCMLTVPYIDDLELIRLRGMVALWTADLVEDISPGSEASPTSERFAETNSNASLSGMQHDDERSRRAAQLRDLASKFFTRLQRQDEVEEQSDD